MHIIECLHPSVIITLRYNEKKKCASFDIDTTFSPNEMNYDSDLQTAML